MPTFKVVDAGIELLATVNWMPLKPSSSDRKIVLSPITDLTRVLLSRVASPVSASNTKSNEPGI